MATVHVLTRKEDLAAERLAGKAVVVLDVLFATSTIVTALAHGAADVVPTLDGAAALAEAAGRAPGSYVLSGELNARTLEGFAHPTPLALGALDLARKTVLYSTTNGTVALARAQGAERVYAGALLNGEAVVAEVLRRFRGETVLLACAGSGGALSLEDFYGAGYLAALLARAGGHDLTDAAHAARLLHDGTDALACLSTGRIGRLMRDWGLQREVEFAAQKSRFAVVPELVGGRLVAATGS